MEPQSSQIAEKSMDNQWVPLGRASDSYLWWFQGCYSEQDVE